MHIQNNRFYFSASSLDHIRFENELSNLNIGFRKLELHDMENTPTIEYTIAPEQVEQASNLFERMEAEIIQVPEKRIVVVTNFIFKWFSRTFLVAALGMLIWMIIQKFFIHH
ncbi:MAG TPA: hypothetical protein VNZ86_03005 [Bacteroidia bacterium]|jgi:hypothetical protein|nr:hypothetical protein [Bacteroidia bacterium]